MKCFLLVMTIALLSAAKTYGQSYSYTEPPVLGRSVSGYKITNVEIMERATIIKLETYIGKANIAKFTPQEMLLQGTDAAGNSKFYKFVTGRIEEEIKSIASILLIFEKMPYDATKFNLTGQNSQGDNIVLLDVSLSDPTVKGEKQKTELIKTFDDPFVLKSSDKLCTISRVELYDTQTKVYFRYNCSGDNLYTFSDAFIYDYATDKRYTLVDTENIPVYPTKKGVPRSTFEYVLIFPPLPTDTKKIDVIESETARAFNFIGVNLVNAPVAETSSDDGKLMPITEITQSPTVKKVIINNFDTDYQFSDGMLAIYNKDLYKWGFINDQGEWIIPCKWDYETFRKPRFSGGYSLIAKEETTSLGIRYLVWYTIDKTGKSYKIPGNVVETSNFCNGYATVIKKGQNGLVYTYINGQGLDVFPAVSRGVYEKSFCPAPRPFVDNLSAFYDFSKKKYGFINKQGQIVIAAKFETVQDFSDGLAAVKTVPSESSASAWGFIDTKGVMVIPAKFSKEPFPFSEGYAVVTKRTGKDVMIDKSGEVVSPEFAALMPFQNGFAFAYTGDRPTYDGGFVLDKSFTLVKGPVRGLNLDSKPYKFYNDICQTAASVSAFSDLHYNFGEDFFQAYGWNVDCLSENLIHCESQNQNGFINYKGEFVILFEKEEF